MTSAFVIYYSIWSLFATHLQKDLNFSPAQVAMPIAIANFLAFLASGFWGWTADHIGRRWSMIIPGIITVFVAPLYLLTDNLSLIVVGFVLQGLFGDALYGQNPSYLSERFPTEVRAAASAFCYHQRAIFGGLVAPTPTMPTSRCWSAPRACSHGAAISSRGVSSSCSSPGRRATTGARAMLEEGLDEGGTLPAAAQEDS